MISHAAFLIVFCSIAAAVGSASLIWYLSRYWDRSGARWFSVTLVAQTVWALSYGVGLLLPNPIARSYAETLSFVGMFWLGPLFLAFTLAYTGRETDNTDYAVQALAIVPTISSILVLSHPLHSLAWTNFRFEPVFGLNTVLYTLSPALYVGVVVSLGSAAIALMLLVETIFSYGPLYRKEALAVTVSTAPPLAGTVVWLAGIGPWPALNLTTVLLLPHVFLDGYAFVGTHMFETSPSTQRAAEQSALDDLNDPLLVVDTNDNVVNANRTATEAFARESKDAFPIPIMDLLGVSLEELKKQGGYSTEELNGTTYGLSYTSLTDSNDSSVGGLLVFYDVTDQRQREQQISVLNRVLRHNLRNELTVIDGHAQMLSNSISNDYERDQAQTIVESTSRLLSISEKVKRFEQIQNRDIHQSPYNVSELLAEIRSHAPNVVHPKNVQIDLNDAPVYIRGDRALLVATLTNLVENAALHTPQDEPSITLSVRSSTRNGNDTVVFEVRDTNPRIDDAELAPLRNGGESALEHGSGIGLWIVNWCVSALEGSVAFEYDDGNVVRVVLPRDIDEGTVPDEGLSAESDTLESE